MGCCESAFGFKNLETSQAAALVTFDKEWAGPKVIISSFAVSGTGTALATAAIEQDRAYYEVRILKLGVIRIGVSHRPEKRTRLAKPIGDNRTSWALNLSEAADVSENDVIGVCFDQSDLRVIDFTLNGRRQPEWSVTGIQGTVYPAISVADGAICDVTFTSDLFDYPVPARFSPIIVTQTLI